MYLSLKIFNANGMVNYISVPVNSAGNPDFAFIATAEYILAVFSNGFILNWIFIEITHTVLRFYIVGKSLRIHRG